MTQYYKTKDDSIRFDDPFGMERARRNNAWWDGYEVRPGSDVKDIHAKMDKKTCKEKLVQVMIDYMSPKEIEEILLRTTELNRKRRLSDVNRARILLLYPHMAEIWDPAELEINTLLALTFRDFDRFIGYIDINLLTRKQVRLFFDAEGDKRPLKYIADNMLVERMKEIFTLDMWQMFLKRYPHRAKYFDIKAIRNQTELRRFILDKPFIMKYATLDDMKNCVIDGPTWVRIITKMEVKDRKYIPAGFADWAKKDIFKESLKGRRFKDFAKGWSKGLVG